MIYEYEGFAYGRKILTRVHYEYHPFDPGDEFCPPDPEHFEITRAFDENGEELNINEFSERELELIEGMVEQDYKNHYTIHTASPYAKHRRKEKSHAPSNPR